jgi:WhiB family redox-sensing transcriptional regulator
MDTDLFFPLTENGPSALQAIERAKTVCRRCSVARECLDAALELVDTDGIWGGLTITERRRLVHGR